MSLFCPKLKLLNSMVLLTLLVTIGFLAFSPPRAAAYSNNELVGDSVFLDSSTMTPGQIRDFLAGKGSYLANYFAFSTRDNTSVYAAQIIYEASQDYGINPEAILATLQKEEGLVTDPSPSQGQLNFAMGYGCSDGSGCSKYSGFFNQIDNATWQLRFNYERASGNTNWWRPDSASFYYPCRSTTHYYSPGLYPGNNVTFYDDYGNAYTSFVIANASTASLYCYTPHAYPGSSQEYFSGSYNFVVDFEAWFGSVIGDLVRTPSNGTVYLISGSNKYPIADSSVLNDFSILGPIRYVTDASLNAKNTGSVLGHMVGAGDGTLYFVDAGIKLPFSTCSGVADYGYSCGQIDYLSDAQLSKLVTGPLATSRYNTTSGKQFYITAGQKHEIFDNTAATQAGLNAAANTLLETGISYLPYGTPVIRDQVVAVDRDTHEQFYYYSNGYLGLTGDLAVLPAFASLPHSNLDDASVPSGSRDNSFRGLFKNSGSTQFYALLPNGKALLTNPSAWPASSFKVLNDTFINGVANDTSGNINSQLIKSPSNGTVYYVNSGKERPVASWSDLLGLKITPFTINTIPDAIVGTIPVGSFVYAPGSLVKTANSATVYIAKDASTLFPISSFTFPIDLGTSMNIKTIANSDISSYSVSTLLQTKIICNSNDYVGINGTLYSVSAGNMTTYGFNQSDFVDVGSACLNLVTTSTNLPNFIRTQNGTIYTVNNGQKQAFTNYQAYLAHGGTPSNTISVSDYFASTIASGSQITQ